MRTCAAAVSPAASCANTTAPFCVWSGNSTSLPGDAQHPNVEFWCFSIHLEGRGGAGRSCSNAEAAQCCLPPTLCPEWLSMLSTFGRRIVCPCWEPRQQQVSQGDPIAMSMPPLLFTASFRDFFTSSTDLGQSQGCKAKRFPVLSAKPRN